ncbi:MAG: NAD(+)/NADH kinase [Eubacterium sp.]|nr:NAD(+)/NADH kinase [Eubacterium sp.]
MIITNEIKDPELRWSNMALKLITDKGYKAELHAGLQSEGLEQCFEDTDVIMVMGGDGTMLRVSHALNGRNIPVIGINLGTVGFLTEATVAELDEVIDRLAAGDYAVEDRMMLQGTVRRNAPGKSGDSSADIEDISISHALNDIVLARESALRLIAVEIYVNGIHFDTCEADGIIVSTPTGSTGYNLSAGGPIVKGDAKLMVMTPISPYSLSLRSVIFGAEDKIEIRLIKKRQDALSSGLVSFDGAETFHMEVGSSVEIVPSSHTFSVVKLDNVSVYEILRKKLGG